MFPVRCIVIGWGVDGVEKGKTIQGSNGLVSELGCLTLRLLSQLRFAKVTLKFTLPRDMNCPQLFAQNTRPVMQCFSTAGPRPGTGPWHQLYRAARGSPGICHFRFLSNFHE